MNDDATPAKVRLTDGLGPPLEDALKRAYYYTEAGEWRGPEVDEWDRWHAVAKVAAAQVEAEREACARVCDDLADISGHYAIAATAIRKRGEE